MLANLKPLDGNSPSSTWATLVNHVQAGDSAAIEQVYNMFNRGIRFYIVRQLGPQDLDDKIHDTFLVVIRAIQRGELREPERLMGFVRTVVRRHVAHQISDAIDKRNNRVDIDSGFGFVDPRPNPEYEAMVRQRAQLIKSSLAELSVRDRELLERYYLREQDQQTICREMNLTETQFRIYKSRAKAKFGDIGKRKVTPTSALVDFSGPLRRRRREKVV